MSVNEKIRLIRETKGLTQEQVAEKLKMSVNAYGDIERGNNDVKLSRLEKLAELFEMQVSELVDLSDKGTLNITFACTQKKFYIGSSTSELEKQQLIIELKDKELAMKEREIVYLKEMLDMYKNIKTNIVT